MLVSPLRYPGGKAKLFEFFALLIQQNKLFGCTYCEPYAGGAGLALRLLSGGFVERIELNDVDEAIWAFWTSVLDYNREFRRLIETSTLTIEEWHRQRQIWECKDLSDPLSLGFATFFLNRTNRSGIIEGAGPVGGYAQAGRWRLDARFDKVKQAASIQALVPYRNRMLISRFDALEFLKSSLPNQRALTYLDPPYYVKGSKLYRNSYVHIDHERVRDAVSENRAGCWVVSYDAVSEIRAIYSDYEPISYSLSYSAGQSGAGREIIFLSDALVAPVLKGFLREAA